MFLSVLYSRFGIGKVEKGTKGNEVKAFFKVMSGRGNFDFGKAQVASATNSRDHRTNFSKLTLTVSLKPDCFNDLAEADLSET